MIATLFLHPWHMPSVAALWLVVPLCAAVAVVYKAIRVQDVTRLARETIALVLYMMGGLTVLGAGLWFLVKYWPQ